MVTVVLTGHRRRLRLLVHGALMLLWALGEAGLIASYAHAGSTPGLVMLVAWTLAGVTVFWNYRRPGAGRETISVTPTHLLITRAVGPFLRRRRYALVRIARPRASRVSIPPVQLYRIDFEYGGRVHRFGRNLTRAEADCIVSLILDASGPLDAF
jgi:hypothetical protein